MLRTLGHCRNLGATVFRSGKIRSGRAADVMAPLWPIVRFVGTRRGFRGYLGVDLNPFLADAVSISLDPRPGSSDALR